MWFKMRRSRVEVFRKSVFRICRRVEVKVSIFFVYIFVLLFVVIVVFSFWFSSEYFFWIDWL